MGMSIEEIEFALNSIKIVLEHTEKGYYPEQFKTHEECLKEVMDIVRKYQQLQADYETRLKADMVAMLTELQLEIEEHKMTSSVTNQGTWNECIACCSRVIQQKINSLKEGNDGILPVNKAKEETYVDQT